MRHWLTCSVTRVDIAIPVIYLSCTCLTFACESRRIVENPCVTEIRIPSHTV